MPDHPTLLQSYYLAGTGQDPDFPALKSFLAFWERALDGKLHSVRVASVAMISPGEVNLLREVGYLN